MKKVIFGLLGIFIPLFIIFIIETFLFTTDGFSTNSFAIFIIPVFGSPLWISLIVLGITEIMRSNKTVGYDKNKQLVYLNRDIKIVSFLCSMAIGIICFGFLTGGGGKYVLPILINNYYYVLAIVFIVTFLSFIIIYKKLQVIEKNKPGFISYTFFNKKFKGKLNSVGYETYREIVKEIKMNQLIIK